MSRSYDEQLTHFLSDMYSVEEQALAQLKSAPKIAGNRGLAQSLEEHHEETKQHAALVESRLTARGGSTSALKEAIMKVGGKGFLLFAQTQPESPGRLIAHAYAYEAMEWAGYELLVRFARCAEDPETVAVAEKIRAMERDMMERLETQFETAAQASHEGKPAEGYPEQLRKHLGEAHALERQGEELLKKSEKITPDNELAAFYHELLEMTHRHREQLERRLETCDSSPPKHKDAALAIGGTNWGMFFQKQSDTAAKLAAFVYAFEHLKIAGYELLKKTAQMAGDQVTVTMADQMIMAETPMVSRLESLFDRAVATTLETLTA